MGWFTRSLYSEALGLPKKLNPPPDEELEEDAARIVEINLRNAAAAHRGPPGAPPGQVIFSSPIWEPAKSDTVVHATLLPAPFFDTYVTGKGAETIVSRSFQSEVARLVEWMLIDHETAHTVLSDTLDLYVSKDAPTKSLGVAYKPHYKLLSLLLADCARKTAGGMTLVEILSSLSFTREALAEMRSSSDPTPDQIEASSLRKLAALREREAQWMSEALR